MASRVGAYMVLVGRSQPCRILDASLRHGIMDSPITTANATVESSTTSNQLLNEIKEFSRNALEKNIMILERKISWDAFQDLYHLCDKLPNRPSLRVSYFDGGLFVQCMPSSRHALAHIKFARAIEKTLPQGITGRDSSKNLLDSRQSTSGDAAFEADSALAPVEAQLPTLIIECGASQSYPSLLRKADAWLANLPSVQGVIIIKLYHNVSHEIVIELWVRNGVGKSLSQAITVDQNTTVCPSFDIPFAILFSSGSTVIPSIPMITVSSENMKEWSEIVYAQIL